MDSTLPAAKAFVDALLRLDFEAMEATLDSKVEFRALVPGEIVNVHSASEAVQQFRRWLSDKSGLELLHEKSETLIDRLLLEYRVRLRRGAQQFVFEQRVFATVENGKFAVLDMICSGLRPEGVTQTKATVHQLDAGDPGA